MTRWKPLIIILTGETVLGTANLPEVESEVIPRVGERIGLGERVHLAYGVDAALATGGPVVSSVNHLFSYEDETVSSSVIVEIQAQLLVGVDKMVELIKTYDLHFIGLTEELKSLGHGGKSESNLFEVSMDYARLFHRE